MSIQPAGSFKSNRVKAVTFHILDLKDLSSFLNLKVIIKGEIQIIYPLFNIFKSLLPWKFKYILNMITKPSSQNTQKKIVEWIFWYFRFTFLLGKILSCDHIIV